MLDEIKKEMSEYSNTQTNFLLKQASSVMNKSDKDNQQVKRIKKNENIVTSKSSPRGFKLPADDNSDQANSFVLNRTGQFSIEPGMMSNGDMNQDIARQHYGEKATHFNQTE